MGKIFHYLIVDYATADATRRTMVPVAPSFSVFATCVNKHRGKPTGEHAAENLSAPTIMYTPCAFITNGILITCSHHMSEAPLGVTREYHFRMIQIAVLILTGD